MQRLTRDRVCYQMSRDNAPVLRVAAGESFVLETKDCYSNNLRSPRDVFTKEMWDTVNPATGPVFIEGAMPGDVLRVDIQEITMRSPAVMCVEHDFGPLGARVEGIETAIYPLEGSNLRVAPHLSLPVRPMIGVIGVAPEAGAVLNGTPGEHGGNMDCLEITAGAAVYLPVNVKGALLAAGDIHAAMGDGEVATCGAEVAGEIRLRAEVIQSDIPMPCVETASHLHFIGAGESLEECEAIVIAKAHHYLTAVVKMRPNEAVRMMSLVGNLQVCQVVNPLKTMRFSLPKSLADAYAPQATMFCSIPS